MTKKITAILGDFYHQAELAVQSLEAAMKKLSIEAEIDYITIDELSHNLNSNPDLMILFAENRLNPEDEEVLTWMDETIAKNIQQYVQNGGNWLAWHSGLASYENVKTYTDILKGYFIHHPEQHQQVTYTVDGEAMIIDQDTSFTCLDEHYFVEVNEADTNVFLRSKSVDGESIAGWHHSYGEGKVVCLTPAHIEAGLLQPSFLNILSQVIDWCLQDKE